MRKRTVFLVRKLVVYGCSPEIADDLPELDDSIPGCSGVRRWLPVAAFATRAEAEADAERRNAAACEPLNPVWMLTRLNTEIERSESAIGPLPDPAEFGVAIPPPEMRRPEYGGEYPVHDNQARWYDEHAADWPPHVRRAVWHQIALNVGFYDVVEMELDD